MYLCSQHMGEPCTLYYVLARVAVLLPCEQTNSEPWQRLFMML